MQNSVLVLCALSFQVVKGQPCEVQEISTRASTGGSFTLTYNGETTKEIPWDASAEVLQAALEVRITNEREEDHRSSEWSATDLMGIKQTHGYFLVRALPCYPSDLDIPTLGSRPSPTKVLGTFLYFSILGCCSMINIPYTPHERGVNGQMDRSNSEPYSNRRAIPNQ